MMEHGIEESSSGAALPFWLFTTLKHEKKSVRQLTSYWKATKSPLVSCSGYKLQPVSHVDTSTKPYIAEEKRATDHECVENEAEAGPTEFSDDERWEY